MAPSTQQRSSHAMPTRCLISSRRAGQGLMNFPFLKQFSIPCWQRARPCRELGDRPPTHCNDCSNSMGRTCGGTHHSAWIRNSRPGTARSIHKPGRVDSCRSHLARTATHVSKHRCRHPSGPGRSGSASLSGSLTWRQLLVNTGLARCSSRNSTTTSPAALELTLTTTLFAAEAVSMKLSMVRGGVCCTVW